MTFDANLVTGLSGWDVDLPTDADIDAVRSLYAALAGKEMAAVAACFHHDAVWHLPGRSVLAGSHRGWPTIRDNILARQGPLSGGTFRAQLLDLAIGDEYLVAVVRATANDAGRLLDQTVCQLMRVEDGAIREVWGHYADAEQLEQFWGSDDQTPS